MTLRGYLCLLAFVWLSGGMEVCAEPPLPGLEALSQLASSLYLDLPEQDQFNVRQERIDNQEELLLLGEPWNLELIVQPELEIGNRQDIRDGSGGRSKHDFDDDLFEGEFELGFQLQRDFLRPAAQAEAGQWAFERDRLDIDASRLAWLRSRLEVLYSGWFSLEKTKRLMPIVAEEAARRQSWTDNIAMRTEQGGALPIELETARLSVLEIQDEAAGLRQDRDRAQERIAAFISPGAELPALASTGQIPDPDTLTVDRLMEISRQQHARRILRRKTQLSASDDDALADLTPRLRLRFGSSGLYHRREYFDEEREDGIAQFNGRLEVQFPLASKARKTILRKEQELASEQDRIALEIWDARQRLRLEDALVALEKACGAGAFAEKSLDLAHERARITRLNLANEGALGKKTHEDLEKALQDVYKAKRSAIDAEIDVLQRYYQLGLLLGAGLGDSGTESAGS